MIRSTALLLLWLCWLPGMVSGQSVIFQSEPAAEVFPIGHLLGWETSFEAPGATFVVERSTDGLDFTDVQTLKSKGNAGVVNTYQFLDADVTADPVYYRIRVEFPGQPMVRTEIAAVHADGPNRFSILRYSDVYTTDVFNLEVMGREAGQLTWLLQDLNQEYRDSGQWIMTVGSNEYALDLSTFPEGDYRLYLEFGQEREELTLRRIDEARLRNMSAGSQPIPTDRN